MGDAAGATSQRLHSDLFRKLQLTPVRRCRDPAQWNEEVVRALASRLPFGRKAVTKKCAICKSIFNPCLCSFQHEGRGSLVAPRIVEISEGHRLNHMGMGSLSNVKSHTFVHGMDRSRLLVGGGPAGSSKVFTVLSRCSGMYIVAVEDEPDWNQTLELDEAQLQVLLRHLAGKSRSGVKTYPSEQDEYDNCLTVDTQEELFPGKRTSLEVNNAVEASNLKLLAVPSLETSEQNQKGEVGYKYYVLECDKDCGVRPGQALIHLQFPRKTGMAANVTKVRMQTVYPHKNLMKPFLLEDNEASDSDDGAAALSPSRRGLRRSGTMSHTGNVKDAAINFPCTFTFDPLPTGWIVDGIELPEPGRDDQDAPGAPDVWKPKRPEDFERMLEQLKGRGSLRTHFRRKPILVVRRHPDVRLRHEHLWERTVKDKKQSIRDDFTLLYEWGVNSRLTPSQLEYTFKKLINRLSLELQEFEAERARLEQAIVQKGARLVEVKDKALHEEILKEMRALFRQCPLYFLYEVKDGCRYNPAEDDSHVGHCSRQLRRRLTSTIGPEVDHHGGEGGEVHHVQAGKTYQRFIKLLAEEKCTGTLRMRLTSTTGGTSTRTLMLANSAEAVLNIIGQAAEEMLHDIEEGVAECDEQQEERVPGRIQVKWNAGHTAYIREYPGRNDGRLSFDEFSRVLHSAGISWLTKAELERNFNAMDVDRSGYLSLGEVLRVSERLLDHIRHLKIMAEEKHMSENETTGTSSRQRRMQFSELLADYMEHFPEDVTEASRTALEGEPSHPRHRLWSLKHPPISIDDKSSTTTLNRRRSSSLKSAEASAKHTKVNLDITVLDPADATQLPGTLPTSPPD